VASGVPQRAALTFPEPITFGVMNSLETLLFLAWVSFFRSLLPETVPMKVAQLEAFSSQDFPDLYEASIAELQEGLEKRHFTSVNLVKVHHLSRLLLINASYSFA
jgi:hypothetical protein